jgi:hypothetical protein
MDIILTAYFQILPPSYFLLIIGFGITAIIVYTIYGFFDE